MSMKSISVYKSFIKVLKLDEINDLEFLQIYIYQEDAT